MGGILYDCLYHAVPILLCVLGGIFAYKANVLNIAMEGMMLAGAFVSVLVSFQTGRIISPCNTSTISLGTEVYMLMLSAPVFSAL